MYVASSSLSSKNIVVDCKSLEKQTAGKHSRSYSSPSLPRICLPTAPKGFHNGKFPATMARLMCRGIIKGRNTSERRRVEEERHLPAPPLVLAKIPLRHFAAFCIALRADAPWGPLETCMQVDLLLLVALF